VDAVIADEKARRRKTREINKKARDLASRAPPKKSANAPVLPPIPIAVGPSLASRIGDFATAPLPPRPLAPLPTYHAPGPLALPLLSFQHTNKETAKARFQSQILATLKRYNVVFAVRQQFAQLPPSVQEDLHVIGDQLEWLANNFEAAFALPDVDKFRISYGLKYIGGVKTHNIRKRYLIVVNELKELLFLGYFRAVPCKEEI
jgi:hypothetical protein